MSLGQRHWSKVSEGARGGAHCEAGLQQYVALAARLLEVGRRAWRRESLEGLAALQLLQPGILLLQLALAAEQFLVTLLQDLLTVSRGRRRRVLLIGILERTLCGVAGLLGLQAFLRVDALTAAAVAGQLIPAQVLVAYGHRFQDQPLSIFATVSISTALPVRLDGRFAGSNSVGCDFHWRWSGWALVHTGVGRHVR